LSSFRPSGVSWNNQEKIRTRGNPMANTMTAVRMAASPKPKAGKMVSTTWTTSQDVTT
jgi:hypothetical protein